MVVMMVMTLLSRMPGKATDIMSTVTACPDVLQPFETVLGFGRDKAIVMLVVLSILEVHAVVG
jgi:hypothetical protein